MPTERWRRVPHYPHVEVSDRGGARSNHSAFGRSPADEPHALRPDARGRIAIARGTKVNLAVLVLEAFVGPRPTPQHVALRADQDPHNNALSNLRWATQGELAVARNPRGEDHPHHGKRLTARGWRAPRKKTATPRHGGAED